MKRQRRSVQAGSFSRAIDRSCSIEPGSGDIVAANPAATFYGYPLDHSKTMSVNDINTLPADRIAQRDRAGMKSRSSSPFSTSRVG